MNSTEEKVMTKALCNQKHQSTEAVTGTCSPGESLVSSLWKLCSTKERFCYLLLHWKGHSSEHTLTSLSSWPLWKVHFVCLLLSHIV